MNLPTKDTHIYKGMWRPPFESLEFFEFLGPIEGGTNIVIDCPCGKVVSKTHEQYRGYESAFDHWLAGHFDEPVYEEKD